MSKYSELADNCDALRLELPLPTRRDDLRRASAALRELEADKERHEEELVRYAHAFAEFVAERDRLREAATRIQQMVDAQALDEGLWFMAETAAEAYLQQELRRLHATIEGKQQEGE